jgi:hypothetical protein
MSPDYYTCISCHEPTSDYEDIRYCNACKEVICYRCKTECSLGNHMYGCKTCRNDDFTEKQLRAMLRECMEFNSDWLQLRDILRAKKVISPAPVFKEHSDIDQSESEEDVEEEDEEETVCESKSL